MIRGGVRLREAERGEEEVAAAFQGARARYKGARDLGTPSDLARGARKAHHARVRAETQEEGRDRPSAAHEGSREDQHRDPAAEDDDPASPRKLTKLLLDPRQQTRATIPAVTDAPRAGDRAERLREVDQVVRGRRRVVGDLLPELVVVGGHGAPPPSGGSLRFPDRSIFLI